MKKIFLLSLITLCLTSTLSAQDSRTKVVSRFVEKNKKPNSKKEYNYMLLDAVKGVDDIYTEFETYVQSVWDKKEEMDSIGSATPYLKDVEEYRNVVANKPVYVGGNAYQVATLEYIDAVKEKIITLGKYGALGSNPNSDFDLYNKASIAFDQATNVAITKRNKLREEKSIYEKSFYSEK